MARKKETRGGWNKKYRTKEQAKKAKNKSSRESAERTTTIINIRFHNIHDKDILDQLGKQENKCGYIKSLIRSDIAK
jgi:hypothetical protein